MSDDELWCPTCQGTYPGYLCPSDGEELVAVPVADIAPPEPETARLECWKCGTRALNAANEDCHECHAPMIPPALVIEFPAGPVTVRSRETSAELGRAGEHGRIFARHPNVSRRHATVSVDAVGDAWLTPFPEAPNGTFVNDQEITARTMIGPGDRVRFASDRGPAPGPVSDSIRRPSREG